MVRVIKKDNTKEAFNIQKVVIAVNKSANRVLYTFTEEELENHLSVQRRLNEAYQDDVDKSRKQDGTEK